MIEVNFDLFRLTSNMKAAVCKVCHCVIMEEHQSQHSNFHNYAKAEAPADAPTPPAEAPIADEPAGEGEPPNVH